jgi:hypothetical protein
MAILRQPGGPVTGRCSNGFGAPKSRQDTVRPGPPGSRDEPILRLRVATNPVSATLVAQCVVRLGLRLPPLAKASKTAPVAPQSGVRPVLPPASTGCVHESLPVLQGYAAATRNSAPASATKCPAPIAATPCVWPRALAQKKKAPSHRDSGRGITKVGCGSNPKRHACGAMGPLNYTLRIPVASHKFIAQRKKLVSSPQRCRLLTLLRIVAAEPLPNPEVLRSAKPSRRSADRRPGLWHPVPPLPLSADERP